MNEAIAMEKIAEKEKVYKFRELCAEDIFPMFKIISKIGVNEFTACFDKDGLKGLIAQASAEGGEDKEQMASIVGVSVVLEVANVVFSKLPDCKEDIYHILSQTSNLSKDKIRSLPFATFTEMVIDFIKKEEFVDFIKVVSKLFV